MPTGYDYYALNNLYIGYTLAFAAGMLVPDTTVTSQGWVVGVDVQAIGTPPPTPQVLIYTGTPSTNQVPQWNGTGWTPATVAGGGASALTPTAVKTSAYTAAGGDLVPVDTTSVTVTITLPTAPPDKTQVGVKHVIRGGTNVVIVALGGSDVLNKAGGSTSFTLTLANQGAQFQYKASGAIWYVVGDDLSLSTLDARYSGGALPVYVTGAHTNRYDPATNFYNLKASNTRKFRAALGRCAVGGQGTAMIVSDSSGAGCVQSLTTPAGFDRYNAWPISIGKNLAKLGVPVAGTGIIRWVDGPSNSDARGSSTGTWANSSAYTSSSTNGSTLTCTLAAGDFPSITTYTTVEVWYYDTGTATFTVSVNGAVSGTGFATVTQANTAVMKKVVVPGVAVVAGSTIKITKTSASLTILPGVQAYTPAAGFVVHNASQSGATASGTGTQAWTDTTSTGLGYVYIPVAGPASPRSITDGTTTTGTTHFGSATAAFTNADIGSRVIRPTSSAAIPDNAYIASITSSTQAELNVNATATASSLACQIGSSPDVVFICLGGNDTPVSVTPIATIITALTNIRNTYPNADCILVSEEQKNDTLITAANWEAYVSALYALADTLDVPLFDYRDRIGNYATGTANGQYGDNLAHLTAGAYADWGRAIANSLYG